MFYGTSHLYVYTPPPIDHWVGWTPARKYRADDNSLEESDYDPSELLACVERAKDLATSCGWEGDGMWQIAGLPPESIAGPLFMLAVKQRNNGTTFIVSPRELPWLRHYLQLTERV